MHRPRRRPRGKAGDAGPASLPRHHAHGRAAAPAAADRGYALPARPVRPAAQSCRLQCRQACRGSGIRGAAHRGARRIRGLRARHPAGPPPARGIRQGAARSGHPVLRPARLRARADARRAHHTDGALRRQPDRLYLLFAGHLRRGAHRGVPPAGLAGFHPALRLPERENAHAGRARTGSQTFFSRELCAKYFTYTDSENRAHFVLYDDPSTLEAKLAQLAGCGVQTVFALFPDAEMLLSPS